MATLAGTAADHLEMVEELRDFLVGEGWVVDGGPAAGAVVNGDTLYLRAPGVNNQQPKVALRPVSNGSTYWNIAIVGLTSVPVPATTLENQPNRSDFIYVRAANTGMTYRFNCNDTACWGWFRVGTVYQTFYFGFILPLHLPDEYPYPLVIGGSGSSETTSFTSTSTQNRSFWQTFDGIRVCVPSGDWRIVGNLNSNDGWLGWVTNSGTYPWNIYMWNVVNIAGRTIAGNDVPIRGMVSRSISNLTLGQFQGVFYVTGEGKQAEDTIVEGGVTFDVLPNVFRTDWYEWVAMERG